MGTIIVIILLVYGFLNVPLANQMASPFLAIVLIYFVYKFYDQKETNKILLKNIDEIKEELKKLTEEKSENHNEKTKEDK